MPDEVHRPAHSFAARQQEFLRDLCLRYGPRPAGSDGIRYAREALGDEWRAMGLREVRTEPVALQGWRVGEAAVEAPGLDRSTDCVECPLSQPGDVTAPIVDCRGTAGSAAGRPAASVRGCVAMVSGWVVDSPALRDWRDSGVAALLVSDDSPTVPRLFYLYREVPFPVVGIARDAADQLARLKPGAMVRVRTTGRAVPVTCGNLVGLLGPANGETILLSAHLDTHHLAPGAFDNLTGIGAITGIAERLRPHEARFRRQLRVIAYTGEEYSFAGSRSYVHDHAAELSSVRFVFNMDALYDRTALGVAAMAGPEVREYVRRCLRDAQQPMDIRDLFCTSSDYLPFLLSGIPCARPADFTGSFPRHYHTRLDDADHAPLANLKDNVDAFAPFVLHLLTDEQLPARISEAQLSEAARRDKVLHALRWRLADPPEWPWLNAEEKE